MSHIPGMDAFRRREWELHCNYSPPKWQDLGPAGEPWAPRMISAEQAKAELAAYRREHSE